MVTAVALGVLLAGACTSVDADVTSFPTTTLSDVPPTPDTVPVTLYFRSAVPKTSELVAVEREIARTDDPARRALELLIAGPKPSEGLPVLPTDMDIRQFAVEDEIAYMVLDGDLDEGPQEGPVPDAGLLALAALANTLTQFPSITSVKLRTPAGERPVVDGWGVPPTLVRDETFIGPDENDPIPDVAAFSTGPQVLSPPTYDGPAASASSSAVRVASVRVVDRLTYVRIVVELDADTDRVPIPQAEALATGNALRLRLADITVSSELPSVIEGPGGAVAEVTVQPEDGDLLLAIRSERRRVHPFHLLTHGNPPRIILDVKK